MSYLKMLAIELFVSTLCGQAWAVVGGIAFEDLPEVASKKLIRSTERFLLSTDKGDKHLCSGVIVAEHRILSAAHCFKDPDVRKAMEEGRVTMISQSQNLTMSSDSIKLDPDAVKFSPDGVDLAVVKVGIYFPESMRVPLAYSRCIDDSPYIVAGFGTSSKSQSSSDLKNLSLRSVKLKKTDSGEGALISLEKTHDVKSGVSNGMGCFGDSGGPTFCKVDREKWALAGINVWLFPRIDDPVQSTLTPAQKCDSSTYYKSTSVRHNMDTISGWLNSNTGSNTGSNAGTAKNHVRGQRPALQ